MILLIGPQGFIVHARDLLKVTNQAQKLITDSEQMRGSDEWITVIAMTANSAWRPSYSQQDAMETAEAMNRFYVAKHGKRS